MKNSFIIAFSFLLLSASCSPQITKSLVTDIPPLPANAEVAIYGIAEDVPAEARLVGEFSIINTNFAFNCNWDDVIEQARVQARAAGGNIVKIIRHIEPGPESSCHQIYAKVLLLDAPVRVAAAAGTDELLAKENRAMLHFYRFRIFENSNVNYRVYAADHELATIWNGSKSSVGLDAGSELVLDAEKGVPLLRFTPEAGKHYYIKCGFVQGTSEPVLELVDPVTGASEYDFVD